MSGGFFGGAHDFNIIGGQIQFTEVLESKYFVCGVCEC